jgi:hypothetical protein
MRACISVHTYYGRAYMDIQFSGGGDLSASPCFVAAVLGAVEICCCTVEYSHTDAAINCVC